MANGIYTEHSLTVTGEGVLAVLHEGKNPEGTVTREGPWRGQAGFRKDPWASLILHQVAL